MPPSKKSKTTSRSNDLFGAFLGLGCGLAAGYQNFWVLALAGLAIATFVLWRFGVLPAIKVLAFGISGFLLTRLDWLPANDSFRVVVIDARENYLIVQSGLARFYVSAPANEYQIGDALLFHGTYEPVVMSTIEGQFDFASYLRGKGVINEIRLRDLEDLFLFPLRIATRRAVFLAHFDEETKAYLSGLLFNIRDYDAWPGSGFDGLALTHLFGLSGLLIHLYRRFVSHLGTYFFTEKTARDYATITLVPWLVLNPGSIVLWRLVGGLLLNSLIDRFSRTSWSYWDRKGLLGIIMLLISRYMVNNPSFYLSFGLAALLYLVRPHTRAKTAIARLGAHYVPWMILLPYVIATKGSIDMVGLLLFPPLLYVNATIMTLGVWQLYLVPLPFSLKPFVRLADILLKIGDAVTLEVVIHSWGPLIFLIVTLVVASIFLFVEWSHKQYVSRTAALLSVLIILTALPLARLYDQSIHFINVGQGDAILIRNKKHAVLVDTGGSRYRDIATISLIPFMQRLGIARIDTVMITHDDFDHDGALASLEASFPIGQVIREAEAFPLVAAGIKFENLNHVSSQGEDDNMASLVLLFAFLDAKWLLMGDAPQAVEEDILMSHPELDIDYLKVGHHGSDTATSAAFIAAISPREAIISVGRNFYGHPHQGVLMVLAAADVRIRRTDKEGTISYRFRA